MPVMKDKIFAVIDTNVIVSALLSSNLESNPVKVFRAIVQERIVPLYNDEILEEYRCVLSRPKFHLDRSLIETVIKAIVTDGLNIDRTPAADIDFPDPRCSSLQIRLTSILLVKQENLRQVFHNPSAVPFSVFPIKQSAFNQGWGHPLDGTQRFADMCGYFRLGGFRIGFQEIQQGDFCQSAIQSAILAL